MLFTKEVMVDLSWCSSYPYQQIQCAEHIVNTKSNYRIILFFLEKKLKWKRIPKTVRKKRYWYTSPGYSKTKIICGKRARHKIDTSSRPRKTITWDLGQMSQPASPRFHFHRPWKIDLFDSGCKNSLRLWLSKLIWWLCLIENKTLLRKPN